MTGRGQGRSLGRRAHGATVAQAVERLRSPALQLGELTWIAAAFPALRAAVAAHPGADDGLRAWIAADALAAATSPAPAPAPAPSPSASGEGSPPQAAEASPEQADAPRAAAPPAPAAAARRRGPWLGAWVTTGAAVLAAAALAVVLVTRPAPTDPQDPIELGAATPEAAATQLVERLAARDFAGAVESFASVHMVDGYSFAETASASKGVGMGTWLPTDGYRSVDLGLRASAIAGELRSMVWQLMVPGSDGRATTPVGDGVSGADLAADLDPAELGGLGVASLARVPEVPSADVLPAATLGASERATLAVLYDTGRGTVMGGVSVLRYGDRWYVEHLIAPSLDLGHGELRPADATAFARAVSDVGGTVVSH